MLSTAGRVPHPLSQHLTQDLIAQKQARTGHQVGNQPSKLPKLAHNVQHAAADAGNRDPALVASRHSTSAVHVTQPKLGKAAAAHDKPLAYIPAKQQQHRANQPAAAPVAISVDELLTGPPVAAAAGFAAAGPAAVMAAALRKSGADAAALKQDFLQHLATRPVARASISGNSSMDELLSAAASSSDQAAVTSSTAGHLHTASATADSAQSAGLHVLQRVAAGRDQHHAQPKGGASGTAVELADVPLRLQYSTTSNSGGSSGDSSWQTMSVNSSAQLSSVGHQAPHLTGALDKHVMLQQYQGPAYLAAKRNSTKRSKVLTQSEQEVPHHHELQHQQHGHHTAAKGFTETEGFGLADAEEQQLRQSNDKLDKLLASTVKKSQQSVNGKENRNRQV